MTKRVRSVESEISTLRSGAFNFGALPANLKFIHWSLCIRKIEKSNHRNSRFFSLKIVNRHKTTLRTLIIKIKHEITFTSPNISDIENPSIIRPESFRIKHQI